MPRLSTRQFNGYVPSEVSSRPPGFSSRPHGSSSESESESDSEDERHPRIGPRKSYFSAITQFPKKKKKYVHSTISKDCTAGRKALCVDLLAELGKKNVPYSTLSGRDPEMSHSRRTSIRDTEMKTDLESDHPPQPRYFSLQRQSPEQPARHQQQNSHGQVGAFDKFQNPVENPLHDQTNRRPGIDRYISQNSATNPEDIVFGPPRMAFASSGRGTKPVEGDKTLKDGDAQGRFAFRNRNEGEGDRLTANRATNPPRRRGDGSEQDSNGWIPVKPRKSFGAENAERFQGRMGENFQDEKTPAKEPRYLQQLRNAHDGHQSPRGVHSDDPDHSDDSEYTGLPPEEYYTDVDLYYSEEDNTKKQQKMKEPSSKERRSPYRADPPSSKKSFAMEYIQRTRREYDPTSYNDGPAAPVPPQGYSPLTHKGTRNRAGYVTNQYHDSEHYFTDEEDDTQPVPTMRSGSFTRVQSDVVVSTISSGHHGTGETVGSGFIPPRIHESNEEKLWNLSQGKRENHIQRLKQYF